MFEADSLPFIDLAGLLPALNAMGAHEIRLVTELTAVDLQDGLALDPPRRPVITLDLTDAFNADHAISLALDAIARAVSSLWPALWGENLSDVRDDALGRSHRPIRLAALGRRFKALAPAWADAVVGRLLRGASPRLPDSAPNVEWAQLTLAFAPNGLILAAPLADEARAAEHIRALEWLAERGAVSVLAFTPCWPRNTAFERILHGTILFRPAKPEQSTQLITGLAIDRDDVPLVLALPAAPEGLPHPMSPTEQALYRLIQIDDELRPLFIFNKTVPGLTLLIAKADLLWLDGLVAVEIDGAEHRGAAKFRADRHRDYELMCAGYRVLRMTNEEVATDAALAVEKIRRVARLARGEAR